MASALKIISPQNKNDTPKCQNIKSKNHKIFCCSLITIQHLNQNKKQGQNHLHSATVTALYIR